jgi:hypothetical protein
MPVPLLIETNNGSVEMSSFVRGQSFNWLYGSKGISEMASATLHLPFDFERALALL